MDVKPLYTDAINLRLTEKPFTIIIKEKTNQKAILLFRKKTRWLLLSIFLFLKYRTCIRFWESIIKPTSPKLKVEIKEIMK